MSKPIQVTIETLELALSESAYLHFEHKTLLNKDKTRLRARANGALRTFKTRPGEFILPIKQGLRNYSTITEVSAHEWELVR